MKSVRIQNLRALHDTDDIDLRPLTICVGKNSSGKSSFARFFPLLRQSVEQRTTGPILWYGRLVDFGGFDDALGDESNGEIVFSFKLKAPVRNMRRRYTRKPLLDNDSYDDEYMVISIHLRQAQNKKTYASKLRIQAYQSTAELRFSSPEKLSGVSIDGIEYEYGAAESVDVSQGRLLPRLDFHIRRRFKLLGRDGNVEERIFYDLVDPYVESLYSEVKKHVHGNTKEETIVKIADYLPLSDPRFLLSSCVNVPQAPDSWKESMIKLHPTSRQILDLKRAIFAARLPDLLESADITIGSYFANVRYIEPLRATAQRYYRRQDLAVDEVDSKGENVAMYLNSLSDREKTNFNDWMRGMFDFTVQAANEGGHVVVKVIPDDGEPRNLADMGFGLSQILPILMQLWSVRRSVHNKRLSGVRRKGASVVVIEQPELHLHPAMQAKLGDVFCSYVSEQPSNKSVLIETHSEHLINRVGALIASGKMKSDMVQVVLFDKEDSVASLRVATFDDEGVLNNWPYGFMEPDVI